MTRSRTEVNSAKRLSQLLPALLIALSFGCIRAQIALRPAKMAKMAEVDVRYVSYKVETVEVTGGRFWKPFNAKAETAQGASNTNQPANVQADVYRYRSN